MITRREVLRRGVGAAAALTGGGFLAAWTSARTSQLAPSPTPLAPPETSTMRITCAPCDAPIMAAERYLRDEGFTTIEITDASTASVFASGRAEMGIMFPPSIANFLQEGPPRVVVLGGLHPGCAEIWAQQSIGSVKDLRGRTIVVRSKALSDLAYSYTAVVLKNAGVDPKDVNFVVQADADLVKLYTEGKNDAVFVATTGAAALKANPANKGHIIHSQVMDEPWSKLDCCMLVTTLGWYRANPIAAKRAVRAIFRSADALSADRADAVKLATDKGLFGGANNFANVRTAANMVPVNWRELDAEKSLRFYGALLAGVGLMKISVDEFAKALDLRILGELRTELKK